MLEVKGDFHERLVGRGNSTAAVLGRVDAAGGLVTVRMNPGALRFRTAADEPFDLLDAVRTVRRYGQTRSWDGRVIDPRSRRHGNSPIT